MIAARFDLRWIATIAVALILVIALNPVGYVGGGSDDWQYLNAARCWAEYGPCLPHDHWQGRWPIVATVGTAIALLGESRTSIGLPNLAYSIGCLTLLAWFGNRIATKPVGYLAALFLLATPAFAIELLEPAIGAAELFFLLAAASCVAMYHSTSSKTWIFASGLSLGMAFQARDTAIAALPLALLGACNVARHDRKAWVLAAAGAALPLFIELLTFWIATGDPLWRRHLSLAHTKILSSELPAGIDLTRSPILNPEYIANWHHVPGLKIHWTVDGPINLLANAMAGLSLGLSLLLFAIYGRTLPIDRRRVVRWCLIIGFYWMCFLTYVLAIDPKPRMMFVPVSLAAIALSILVVDLAKAGSRLLAIVAACANLAVGLAVIAAYPRISPAEVKFREWIVHYPGEIEASETTRRHLALVPAARSLPDPGSGRALMVIRVNMSCASWAKDEADEPLLVVEQVPLNQINPLAGEQATNFCLFRYASGRSLNSIAP